MATRISYTHTAYPFQHARHGPTAQPPPGLNAREMSTEMKGIVTQTCNPTKYFRVEIGRCGHFIMVEIGQISTLK
jgi:hypothetical protein